MTLNKQSLINNDNNNINNNNNNDDDDDDDDNIKWIYEIRIFELQNNILNKWSIIAVKYST